MNFKLLIFILVVQSINSSIIENQSIDELVQIGNLDMKSISGNRGYLVNVKNFTFNVLDTVCFLGFDWPEIKCKVLDNDFCTRGEGKYSAQIIRCENLDYGKKVEYCRFDCKLFGSKMLNKNVKPSGLFEITCLSHDVTQETSKGKCIIAYSFAPSKSYNEVDDVENKDKIN